MSGRGPDKKKRSKRVAPLETRVTKRLDTSGGPDACHVWTGDCNNRGYGRLSSGRRDARPRYVFVHRFAYAMANGPIPDGMKVLHKCDNPPCANQRHLFLGTQKTNSDDMMAKGRHHTGVRPRGARHHAPKLLPHLKEIRMRLKRGESQRSVAKLFGVSSNAIRNIVVGVSYAGEP